MKRKKTGALPSKSNNLMEEPKMRMEQNIQVLLSFSWGVGGAETKVDTKREWLFQSWDRCRKVTKKAPFRK